MQAIWQTSKRRRREIVERDVRCRTMLSTLACNDISWGLIFVRMHSKVSCNRLISGLACIIYLLRVTSAYQHNVLFRAHVCVNTFMSDVVFKTLRAFEERQVCNVPARATLQVRRIGLCD